MPLGYLAELKLVSFNFAPRGWAFCDGTLLSIAQNTALFSLLGTTYGGNGIQTFGLPDLRGRVPLHAGQGLGLTLRVLGEIGGSNTVTLTTQQLPNHNHAAHVSSAAANSSDPAAHVLAATADPTYGKVGVPVQYANLAVAGGSQPHANMQPYLGLNWIICLGHLSVPQLMKDTSFSLRAVTPSDREHLFRVYSSTRETELAVVPFNDQERLAFLRMQFAARERSYGERFDAKDHVVVEYDGAPVGYLWLQRSPEELRVVDVALLPEHRGAGIGTALMSAVIDEARERHVPVRLTVLADGNDGARRFYERLGFNAVGDATMYQLMELVP